MDWKVIAGIAIGALFIVGTDVFKFWKRKKPVMPGGIVIGPPRPAYPAGKIFVAWVLSTIALNVLAVIAVGSLGVMADRGVYWAWSIVPMFGWLLIWGFIVNRLLFPKGYIDSLDYSRRPPIGSLPAAICAAVWMWVIVFAAAPMLSVE